MKKSFFVILSLFAFFGMKAQNNDRRDHIRLLAGTYTNHKSKGIYLYDFNTTNGRAVLLDSVVTINPSYLTVSADEKFIYAVNESGAGQGKAISFSFDSTHSTIEKINEQFTGADDPCYISLDHTGNWLLTGNYTGGSFTVFPVNKKTGIIAPKNYIKQHVGKSIDTQRQEKPHVHCCIFSPDNKYLLVADLGIDKIMAYHFDETSGKISGSDSFSLQPGAGPRHIVFHPNGKQVYLTAELTGQITLLDFTQGKFKHRQTVSMLNTDFKGKVSGADIHISNDGKFLYASNRGDANDISIFAIGENGALQIITHTSTLGKTPRNFCLDPSGKYLLLANQDSNTIIIFNRDSNTGLITDSGNRIFLDNPVCLKWLN